MVCAVICAVICLLSVIKSNLLCFTYSINTLDRILNKVEYYFMLWKNEFFPLVIFFPFIPWWFHTCIQKKKCDQIYSYKLSAPLTLPTPNFLLSFFGDNLLSLVSAAHTWVDGWPSPEHRNSSNSDTLEEQQSSIYTWSTDLLNGTLDANSQIIMYNWSNLL